MKDPYENLSEKVVEDPVKAVDYKINSATRQDYRLMQKANTTLVKKHKAGGGGGRGGGCSGAGVVHAAGVVHGITIHVDAILAEAIQASLLLNCPSARYVVLGILRRSHALLRQHHASPLLT